MHENYLWKFTEIDAHIQSRFFSMQRVIEKKILYWRSKLELRFYLFLRDAKNLKLVKKRVEKYTSFLAYFLN